LLSNLNKEKVLIFAGTGVFEELLNLSLQNVIKTGRQTQLISIFRILQLKLNLKINTDFF